MKKNKNKLQVVGEVLFWLVFSIIIGFIALTSISSSNANIPFKSFLIQSGSMEPAIMTGDIIIVKKTNDYKQRDVITFFDHGGRVVTHRIMKVNTVATLDEYTTQGDANQTIDMAPVPSDDVIGEVYIIIPKLGYLVAYSKTKWGILILIIVPATIIIYDEVKKMFKNVDEKNKKKTLD